MEILSQEDPDICEKEKVLKAIARETASKNFFILKK